MKSTNDSVDNNIDNIDDVSLHTYRTQQPDKV